MKHTFKWRFDRHTRYHYYEKGKGGYAHVFRDVHGSWTAVTSTTQTTHELLRDAKNFVEKKFER